VLPEALALPVWKEGDFHPAKVFYITAAQIREGALGSLWGRTQFHAKCFMYYIYNINVSNSMLVSF
jgi:hypothetical protein